MTTTITIANKIPLAFQFFFLLQRSYDNIESSIARICLKADEISLTCEAFYWIDNFKSIRELV